jgi:hypothetical protein
MLGEPLRAPFGRARVGLFAVRCRSYLRRRTRTRGALRVGLVRAFGAPLLSLSQKCAIFSHQDFEDLLFYFAVLFGVQVPLL